MTTKNNPDIKKCGIKNTAFFYCELKQQGSPKNLNFSSLVFHEVLIS